MTKARGTYDFCIVGAGSCGGLVTKQLADRGFRVVALDAGPHYDSTVDFVNDEAEMWSACPDRASSSHSSRGRSGG